MVRLFPSREVALELFGFGVHWYGLLYFAAFVIAWQLLPRLQRYRDLALSPDEWSHILTSAVIGVVVGGRLGYVLFYAPAYYLQHPLEIVAVWQGGMSSHGGFIGVTVMLLFALRSRMTDVWKIADVIVVPIAIGLMLGRIGNVINQELYGTVTSLPWGISIPGEEGLRHPTHVYSALKDLLIAALCFVHLSRFRAAKPGTTFALFLLSYGVLRFTVEAFREQNGVFFDVGPFMLSEGQLLTIPIIIAGIVLGWKKMR